MVWLKDVEVNQVQLAMAEGNIKDIGTRDGSNLWATQGVGGGGG